MLRVSYSDTAGEQRWILSGALAGAWVDEMRSFWQQIRARTPRARALVDLTDVIFVDDAGETLLAEMHSAGTEFIAAGVANKYLIDSLNATGERALRCRMEDLKRTLGKSSTAHEGDK